jgi:tetratricopeptide (TPR) repeat protein
MTKKAVQLIFILGLILCAARVQGITATEVFNDASRAFSQGKYSESEEIFSRFLRLWPEHKLAEEAQKKRLISKARNIEKAISDYAEKLGAEIENEIEKTAGELSDETRAEVQLALSYAKRAGRKYAWHEIANLPETTRNKIILREWYTEPASDPMGSLSFANELLKRQKDKLAPEIESRILLIKSYALWHLLLSPLPLRANARIIKTWGDWPVHTALDKSLRQGFNLANSDLKKKIALLGFHLDCFRHKEVLSSGSSGLNNRWLTYISERGIHRQEAWCPR